MLREIKITSTSQLQDRDILEIGETRLTIHSHGSGSRATSKMVDLYGNVEHREYRSDGIYVGGQIAALCSSTILQLHVYGAKLYREDGLLGDGTSNDGKTPAVFGIPERSSAETALKVKIGGVDIEISVRNGGEADDNG